MKIFDIINETAQESRDIQSIADSVVEFVLRTGTQAISSPLKSIVDRDSNNIYIQRLIESVIMNIILNPDSSDLGQFFPQSNKIAINLPAIEVEAEGKDEGYSELLHDIVVHELQHAVDYYKSQGKAIVEPAGYQADTEDEEEQAYLKLPHEVNARFAEALNDIKRQAKFMRDDSQIMDLVRDALAKRQIAKVFPGGVNDPKYRRLVTRVYKYLKDN